MNSPDGSKPNPQDKLERYIALGHDPQRAELLATLEAIHKQLDSHELYDVWNNVADSRRLDSAGNPIAGLEGLYEAWAASTMGLLQLVSLKPVLKQHFPRNWEENEEHRALVRRLALVGLGAKVHSTLQDYVTPLFQLREDARTFTREIRAGKLAPMQAAEMLARTLVKRHAQNTMKQPMRRTGEKRPSIEKVEASDVDRALQKYPSLYRRTYELAVLVGVRPPPLGSDDAKEQAKEVKALLKTIDTNE